MAFEDGENPNFALTDAIDDSVGAQEQLADIVALELRDTAANSAR